MANSVEKKIIENLSANEFNRVKLIVLFKNVTVILSVSVYFPRKIVHLYFRVLSAADVNFNPF